MKNFFPGKLALTRKKAPDVPIITAITTAIRLTSMECRNADISALSLNKSIYQLKVNLSKDTVDLLELKEKTTTTNKGI
ncbi:MAG: hypothetical protein ACYCZ1_07835 [Candidatus Humimicrobiaceae bacterium]